MVGNLFVWRYYYLRSAAARSRRPRAVRTPIAGGQRVVLSVPRLRLPCPVRSRMQVDQPRPSAQGSQAEH